MPVPAFASSLAYFTTMVSAMTMRLTNYSFWRDSQLLRSTAKPDRCRKNMNNLFIGKVGKEPFHAGGDDS
jgi:hypothetical protein